MASVVSSYAGQSPGAKSPVRSPVSRSLPHPKQQRSWVPLPEHLLCNYVKHCCLSKNSVSRCHHPHPQEEGTVSDS